MRISKISIQNLNSLAGKWEINLDHPDIRNNGIFAICGPTGAGKTTVLDAMALALYGRTPRLDCITQSENEIMTQSTGECSSEVIFEAGSKLYKAHWAQQRAHKNPNGKLQQARPELSYWNPEKEIWELLATQKTLFDKEIARVTGLTYEEFTRSILLAQGSFAAFLKAKSEVRSAALEKITGTQIYSNISRNVQERFAQESANIKETRARLDAIEILPDEVRQQLEEELGCQRQLQVQLNVQAQSLNEARDWLKTVNSYQEEIAILIRSQKLAQTEFHQANEQRPRLEKARQAASIASIFEAKIVANKLLAEQRNSLNNLVAQLSDTELMHKKANADWAQAKMAHDDIQGKWNTLQKTLVEVRKLDSEIVHAQNSAHREFEALKKLTDSKTEKEAALKEAVRNETKIQQVIAQLQNLENPEHPEQKLAGDLSDIELLYENVKSSFVNHQTRTKQLEIAEKIKNTEQKAFEELVPMIERDKERVSNFEKKIKMLNEKIEHIRDGKTSAQWREDGNCAQEKLFGLNEIIAASHKIAELTRAIENTNKDLSEKHLHHQSQLKLQETNKKLLSVLNEKLELFNQQKSFVDLFEQFKIARSDLKDGSPCPLCGSLEHPWAKHLPAQSIDQNEGNRLQRDIQTAQKESTQIEKELAKLEGSIESLKKFSEINQQERADKLFSRKMLLCSLHLSEDTPSEKLEQLKLELSTKLQVSKAKLADLDQLGEELNSAVKQKELAFQDQQKISAKVSATREKLASVIAAWEKEKQETEAARENLTQSLKFFQEKLTTHAIQLPKTTHDLDKTIFTIKSRSKLLHEKLKKLSEARTRQAELNTLINGLKETVHLIGKDIEGYQKTLETLNKNIQVMQKNRVEIFADKNCDTEEKCVQNMLTDALNKRDLAQQIRQKAQNTLSALKGQIQSKEDSVTHLKIDAEHKTNIWESRRNSAGFDTDDAWRKSCMLEEQLLAGQRRIESTKARLDAIEKSLKEKQSLLAELNKSALTHDSLETLESKITELSQKRSACDQKVGKTQEQLDKDTNTRKLRTSVVEEIDRQQKTLCIWEKLYCLIGSADGKKYRQFVQSITFDTLLTYANDALRLMSDRYRLKRDETDSKDPLSINVIDNFQGGIERSSKNLSGGETFIVSLALSLGLSKMAGRNVRLESLFLDEGFGTLDADALDSALSTLATLNSQGKLIGIISHVGEIRERILARIEVEPVSGGISRLSGPGVRLLN